jgi:hypothetical protein
MDKPNSKLIEIRDSDPNPAVAYSDEHSARLGEAFQKHRLSQMCIIGTLPNLNIQR